MINYRGLNEHTCSAVSCVCCDRLIVPTDGNRVREREREEEREGEGERGEERERERKRERERGREGGHELQQCGAKLS